MYTAMTGKNYRLKQLLARNAKIDLQTTVNGPLIDFKVPRKYTTEDFAVGEDKYTVGFT